MGKLIYFIGGSSAAGKSTVTKRLSAISGHQTVKLDKLYDLLKEAMNDERSSEKATRKITVNVIEQFLAFEITCIMEGVWILPDEAKELMNRYGEQFHPVFCGYPNANAAKRAQMIKSGNNHWLCKKSEKYRQNWIQEQIEESQWYQDECKKYDLPFFNFSDVEEGSAALVKNYTEWYEIEWHEPMNSLLQNPVQKKHKSNLSHIRNFLRLLTKY